MGRAVAQVLVPMVRVTVVAVLIPVSRVTQAIKAIRVVIMNTLVRGINSNNLVIRVTRRS